MNPRDHFKDATKREDFRSRITQTATVKYVLYYVNDGNI